MNDQELAYSYLKVRRYLIWGILIATFHINLNQLEILPGFIGWLVITYGTLQLSKIMQCKEIKRCWRIFALYSVVCMIGFIGDTLLVFSFGRASMLYQTFSMILEVIGFFELFQAILEEQVVKEPKKLRNYLTRYLIYSFGGIGLLQISINVIYHSGWALFAAILLILVRISVIYQIYHSLNREEESIPSS